MNEKPEQTIQAQTMVEKDRKLTQVLREMKRVMIAFSGGVDSTFLLKRAQQTLGDQVLAVVAASETFPEREFHEAVEIAQQMGVPLYTTQIRELENQDFTANRTDRCYHCKIGLYSHLRKIALQLGYPYVLDGTNADDLSDYRPGIRAQKEQGVRSVLMEVGLTKAEIRALSKQLGLPTWNKPSFACLSSRIPYGSVINLAKIKQLDAAENVLLNLGLVQVRVRHYDHTARIEVYPEEMNMVFAHRDYIVEQFKKLGFTYVTLDLDGYRTGSMNESLPGGM